MAVEYPEVAIVTSPNRRPAERNPWTGLLLAAVGIGALVVAHRAGVFRRAGVSAEGIILSTTYTGVPVGPCGTVTAHVTLWNDRPTTVTGRLLGYLLPAGQTQASAASGHWWSDLTQGGGKAAYTGVPVTLRPLASTTVVLVAGRFAAPGPYTVLWVWQVGGQTVASRLEPNAIPTSFTQATTHCALV